MSDLTEKWKAGELEEGYYYIKANRTISFVEIDYYHIFGETEYWNGNDNEDVLEVLVPVPTYDQFVDVSKKVEELKLQLAEANKILFNVWNCREDREYYAELAKSYFEKYGVEK